MVNTFIHIPWILGMAGLLATFSHIDWYRRRRSWRMRKGIGRPLAQAAIYANLAIFCLGLALVEIRIPGSGPQWMGWAWGLFGLFYVAQTILALYAFRTERNRAQRDEQQHAATQSSN